MGTNDGNDDDDNDAKAEINMVKGLKKKKKKEGLYYKNNEDNNISPTTTSIALAVVEILPTLALVSPAS